ncbi:ATP-binding protein [Streptomyces sp. SKN60]|uniref:ATP-binding protein n=1 Tax=Streptomyces sp. SKN60 TaxID=2855506 RepID=UPI0022486802|nr:ATP-binding protein [Streptomyces sp. SKN60]MCX2180275.1 ATP-binding protein [Streptomyces sp. SKN60]
MSSATAALPHRHVLTVPTLPAAVRVVRETAEMTFAEWGIAAGHPALGPALLILSELVTNSVRHAADTSPSLTVTFAAGDDTLAFAVHDRHPHHPGVLAATAGGGLAVIAEVMTAAGGTCVVRRDADGGGKSVWITLPLQPAKATP